MEVNWLHLQDFRNLVDLELRPAPGGLTVVLGENGAGKTSLLEAIAYSSTLKSFRQTPRDAVIRDGAETAIIRLEADREGRAALVEISLARSGRDQVRCNRQRITRTDELLEALRVTVFTPDDLVLVKGGPSERRELLDGVLLGVRPRNGDLRRDVDRVLRHRGTLLRQAGGRLTPDIESTLDVWDTQLASVGSELAARREEIAAQLEPVAADAFRHLTRERAQLMLRYRRSWAGDLMSALAAARRDDLRRGVSTIGPHRDDLEITVGELDARTKLSQGRQRCTTLALRLASHELVTDAAGSRPVLLLDDAFSELDPPTSSALLERLPSGQAILTTAGSVPAGASPAATVRIADGTLV
jgi:DNA replication and repair protein RecF